MPARHSVLHIRPLQKDDIADVTTWARQEGFAPGSGDVAIYRHTDRQGIWVGWLGSERVGCITGVRYSAAYGFLGLYLVRPQWRGRGYGLQLWRQALHHLADLPCIGLEAATDRVDDYAGWGFAPASPTTRWQAISDGQQSPPAPAEGWQLLQGDAIPEQAVQAFDAQREPSPRPHFLNQWLQHPAGTVLALIDAAGVCHGFGRIRPCLLPKGEGWRIGPLMAETPEAASLLLQALLRRHPGVVLIDAPGANAAAAPLLQGLGFSPVSTTLRMYRGEAPAVSLCDVFGLACLELG
jgi:ribosomal-protein-alanine N-acetyltransferase